LLRGGSWNDLSTYVFGYPAWHYSFKKELQHSNAAVAVSMVLRSEILRELGKKYSKKLEFIHNGVNIKLLDRLYTETGTDIAESEKTIVFAGSLFWRKGALNIIKMAYLLQESQTDFKVVVHGTGPLFKRMQKYIRSLKLRNIELTGFVTKRQLMKSLKQCRFVAIPAYTRHVP
jgi:glycosyltransferase involved in cell wall biosynthesis